MHNPRWPHTFTAWRESLDERGLPVTDENGDPVLEQIIFEMAVYGNNYDPLFGADGEPKKQTVSTVPWGYRTSTGGIRAAGDVFSTDFKISCPMLFTQLEEGDILKCMDYNHSFDVVVEKMTTYNWGTNIWIKRPGNNGELSE